MIAKEVISRVVEQSFRSRTNAEESMRVLGIDTRLLRSTAPMDDEQPPNGVTGLTATPIYAGVRLNWGLPPAEDYVKKALVEVTPQGQDMYVVESFEATNATVFELESVDTSFRVMFVDEWDRTSAWSNVIVARPVTTADSDIDLAYKQAQGTLQGLIEAVNLAGASAQEGIQGAALASTQANNMLPLIESDIEMWNNTSEWPPASAVLANGHVLIDSDEPVGHTLDMMRHEGHWKIRHQRATPSTNYVLPVKGWREERRVVGGDYYIAQATVSAPAGTVVSIALENAEDAVGTNMTTANEQQFTLTGGTVKIYVKMQASSAKPYVRIRLGLHTDNTTVYWYKFMLEHARANATEPSPWNAGILATGSVASHTLTAITANVAEAVIESAAIQSAMISSLKADKIEAGELHGNVIIAEGMIRGAGATIDGNGIYLSNQNRNPDGSDGANGFPNVDTIGDWLTNNPYVGSGSPQPHSGIGFFDDFNDPRRGILIRARGVSGSSNRDGFISILATSGGTDQSQDTSAYIAIRAERPGLLGTVVIGHRLDVNGAVNLPNNSISSDEIAGLDVNKLNGGGQGHTVDKGLIPSLANLNGDLPWDRVNHPDMSQYVTGAELNNKGYVDGAQVRRIIADEVKANALK